ncbi:hypothetical protein RRG08_019360 [Elysia crispata]|uniref:Uncharacterized protein n=1 Tax=Elysia crispata TaxID=231223 RepID=A0AAE1E9S1_9GAST|nr:hypothetical protein RRG08_019360 [Elysia crispata]
MKQESAGLTACSASLSPRQLARLHEPDLTTSQAESCSNSRAIHINTETVSSNDQYLSHLVPKVTYMSWLSLPAVCAVCSPPVVRVFVYRSFVYQEMLDMFSFQIMTRVSPRFRSSQYIGHRETGVWGSRAHYHNSGGQSLTYKLCPYVLTGSSPNITYIIS